MDPADDDTSDAADRDTLRLLVQLAASGELSQSETDEVIGLIADKPDLRSEFERLQRREPAPPPTPARRASNQSGCLFGLVGFLFAVVAVTAIGITVRSNRDTTRPTADPAGAVLDDPENRVLTLSGPDDLAGFGELALIYSPTQRAGVLLGNRIPSGGELYDESAPQEVLAQFSAGSVKVLVGSIDPDHRYAVRELADATPPDSAG